MTTYTATYSPEDNKLRLSASSRLDAETYARVKAAGYAWAPKQGIFVAPAWSPAREDIALELAGEIDDEDTSLVERQEQRAERFEEYSDKSAADADRAADAVKALADGIPLGQPILIGHHSERHARKDAERIENGMRRAVKMWETSEYWTRRAAAAIAHAKYKERPDVRARRIKTLEAAQRKMQRGHDETERKRQLWEKVTTREQALAVANYSHLSMCFSLEKFPRDPPASQYEGQMGIWSALDGGVITWEKARELAIAAYTRGSYAEHYRRWNEHYQNRLAYERAMLGEAGGLESDKTRPEKGGAVKCWVGGHRWCEIQKVNPSSVSVLDSWGNGGKDFLRVVPFDKLREVITRAAWLEMQGKPADTPAPEAPKPGPTCNYRTEGCIEMLEADFDRKRKSGMAKYDQMEANHEHGRHKTRVAFGYGYKRERVFITDLPEKFAPAGVTFDAREAVPA